MSAIPVATIQFADVLEHELDNIRGAAFLLQSFVDATDEDDESRCVSGVLADALFSTADKLGNAYADLNRAQAATKTTEVCE